MSGYSHGHFVADPQKPVIMEETEWIQKYQMTTQVRSKTSKATDSLFNVV
jgi:hypothetical protein